MEWWRRWYFLWGGDSVGAAILFYTRLPWPPSWPVNFDRIARWITLMGLLLSLILLAVAQGLQWLGMDNLLQSAIDRGAPFGRRSGPCRRVSGDQSQQTLSGNAGQSNGGLWSDGDRRGFIAKNLCLS